MAYPALPNASVIDAAGYASEITNMLSTEPPIVAPVLPHARPSPHTTATANVSTTAIARVCDEIAPMKTAVAPKPVSRPMAVARAR
jgi:hypothetical protein